MVASTGFHGVFTMTNTISVAPTTHKYTNIDQMVRDYYEGRPVMVRGYGQLAGLAIDCFESKTLRELGYTTIEFCLGSQIKEVKL